MSLPAAECIPYWVAEGSYDELRYQARFPRQQKSVLLKHHAGLSKRSLTTLRQIESWNPKLERASCVFPFQAEVAIRLGEERLLISTDCWPRPITVYFATTRLPGRPTLAGAGCSNRCSLPPSCSRWACVRMISDWGMLMLL